jgi:hypothetical protein
MLNELYTNYGSGIFLGTLFCIVLLIAVSVRKKPRKERPDPPSIFGPIRGMYVCYQCDTIFNTVRCPGCNEDAVIPLVHLTGSILEDNRVASVISKLKERSAWEMPSFQDKQTATLEPASMLVSSNGGVSKVPLPVSVLRSERGPELS